MSYGGRETALAFFLGLAAGSVTALLLAPNGGPETRRKLWEGARELKHAAGVKARHLADAAQAGVDRASETTRAQLEAVRGAVAEGREAYSRETADVSE